jgi:hypothetical protein
MTDVEWQMIGVRARSDGSGLPGAAQIRSDDVFYFYKAWKTGHLGLVGYGATLNDAITAMLNKWGEC